jgi:hypothetical protein
MHMQIDIKDPAHAPLPPKAAPKPDAKRRGKSSPIFLTSKYQNTHRGNLHKRPNVIKNNPDPQSASTSPKHKTHPTLHSRTLHPNRPDLPSSRSWPIFLDLSSLNSQLSTLNSALCTFILHPSSFIFHLSSFIFHLSSFILELSTLNSQLCTLHSALCTLHSALCTFILHPSSFIFHPSSFILHP